MTLHAFAVGAGAKALPCGAHIVKDSFDAGAMCCGDDVPVCARQRVELSLAGVLDLRQVVVQVTELVGMWSDVRGHALSLTTGSERGVVRDARRKACTGKGARPRKGSGTDGRGAVDAATQDVETADATGLLAECQGEQCGAGGNVRGHVRRLD